MIKNFLGGLVLCLALVWLPFEWRDPALIRFSYVLTDMKVLGHSLNLMLVYLVILSALFIVFEAWTKKTRADFVGFGVWVAGILAGFAMYMILVLFSLFDLAHL